MRYFFAEFKSGIPTHHPQMEIRPKGVEAAVVAPFPLSWKEQQIGYEWAGREWRSTFARVAPLTAIESMGGVDGGASAAVVAHKRHSNGWKIIL